MGRLFTCEETSSIFLHGSHIRIKPLKLVLSTNRIQGLGDHDIDIFRLANIVFVNKSKLKNNNSTKITK